MPSDKDEAGSKLNHLKLLILRFAKTSPAIFVMAAGAILYLIISQIAGSSKKKIEVATKDTKIDRPKMQGPKDIIDPRAYWSDLIIKDIQKLKEEIKSDLAQEKDRQDMQAQELAAEIEHLKNTLNDIVSDTIADTSEHQGDIAIAQSRQDQTPAKLKIIHKEYDDILAKTPANYIAAGSFARGALLTGVVAGCGTNTANSAQPILIRLIDHAIFSKNYKTEKIKDAIIIGSCRGSISSERALCRLESLSLLSDQGTVIEKKVQGWIIGEDGRPGIKGDVVDKAGDVMRMAVLNGILSGVSSFFQNQATSSIYPVSPISGQSKALKGIDSLKAGTASGVSSALNRLADYAIKRAEQMSPVIIVGSSRIVDVVFKSGFNIKSNNKQEMGAVGINPARSHGGNYDSKAYINDYNRMMQNNSSASK